MNTEQRLCARLKVREEGTMKLLEVLGINDPANAATVLLHEYISDRSVAILQRTEPKKLEIGSGTCFLIGQHYLIATVAHNVEGLALDQIEVVPRGAYFSESLKVTGMNSIASRGGTELDVAWLEIETASFENSPQLNAFSLGQVAAGLSDEDSVPCFLQGYPAKNVELIESNSSARPSVESDGLGTLSIPPSERGVRHQAGVDFSVQYPPHDGSIDHLPLPPPPGISGGGIWLLPRFETGKLWMPNSAELIAITRRWFAPAKEVWGTRVDFWLQLISDDFDDLRGEIGEVIGKGE
jgi:hypothetical protein